MLHSGKGVGGEICMWRRKQVGSTVGEEREGEGVELKMIYRWLLQVPCVPCHIKCIWPHLPYTQTHNVHMHIYTPLQCHPHCGSEEADPVVVLLP